MALVSQLVGCTAFDDWQRRKVLRPTPIATAAEWQALLAQRPDLRAQQLDLGPGEWLQLLQVPPPASAPAPEKTGVETRVLYLHGVLRHAYQNLSKLDGVARNGVAVWAPDYRGWGRSSPLLPDEASLHADVWAVWQSLPRVNAAGQPIRWAIHGHSMGTALAVRLAQRLDEGELPPSSSAPGGYCALVIESGFTRFADIAAQTAQARLGQWAAVLGRAATRVRMASDERIAEVRGPTWFIHGSQDTTVPKALGRALYERAQGPKQWLSLPLSHSNLQDDTTGQYDRLWREVVAHCGAP